eukprot:scaffold134199_cov17-Prasinocladus_malaysianus.AAC.1
MYGKHPKICCHVYVCTVGGSRGANGRGHGLAPPGRGDPAGAGGRHDGDGGRGAAAPPRGRGHGGGDRDHRRGAAPGRGPFCRVQSTGHESKIPGIVDCMRSYDWTTAALKRRI